MVAQPQGVATSRVVDERAGLAHDVILGRLVHDHPVQWDETHLPMHELQLGVVDVPVAENGHYHLRLEAHATLRDVLVVAAKLARQELVDPQRGPDVEAGPEGDLAAQMGHGAAIAYQIGLGHRRQQEQQHDVARILIQRIPLADGLEGKRPALTPGQSLPHPVAPGHFLPALSQTRDFLDRDG